MIENINIKLTPKPYQNRRASVISWTILIYIFIIILVTLSSDIQILLFVIPFLVLLFIFDISRRLLWVRFALKNIETDEFCVKLKYYDKDNLLSVNISWNNLTISRSNTFTKNSRIIISFKNGMNHVASFYADNDNSLDNCQILELYNNLNALKANNLIHH